MLILFFAHRLPAPPTKGEKIRAYNLLRYLSRDHQVDLLTLADEPGELRHLPELEPFCRRIHVVRRGRGRRALGIVRALARHEAISLATFFSPELAVIASEWQRERNYRVLFAFSAAMAQYIKPHPGRLHIMDFVDVDSAKWEQYAKESAWPRVWLFRREGRLVSSAEAVYARTFDVSTFVSEPEANLFRSRVDDAREVRVVPNGVADRFRDGCWKPPARGRQSGPNLVFMGAMDYRPNVDAVRWFCEEILDRIGWQIPGVTFTILGGKPSRSVRQLARRRNVKVTGFVPDVVHELTQADLFIAPLRIARGVQNKVLEALAFGIPVVCTPQALEGIEAEPGIHLLVASEASGFAEAVIELLQNPAQAQAMGSVAKAWICDRYRWERVLAPLDDLLGRRDPGGVS